MYNSNKPVQLKVKKITSLVLRTNKQLVTKKQKQIHMYYRCNALYHTLGSVTVCKGVDTNLLGNRKFDRLPRPNPSSNEQWNMYGWFRHA